VEASGATVVRRRLGRRALIAGGALAAVWLTACGSGSDRSGNARPRARATAVAVPTVEEVPGRRGGVYRLRVAATAPLDPFATGSFRAYVQAGFTMSRLFMFVTGPRPETAYDYAVTGDLAQGHELADGGLRLTVTLHPRARFHDKPPVAGRAVTAEDVRLSLERFRAATRNPNRAAFGTADEPLIDTVETPDERTLALRLARPYAPAFGLLANPSYLWVFPREVDGGYAPERDQIGSGPFVLHSLQQDVETRLVRNSAWHGSEERPYVDALVQVVSPEAAQEVALFQTERIDSATLSFEDRARVERTNPKARWLTYTVPAYTFLSPQQRGASPWRDERLRQALSLAIDRTAWIDEQFGGQGGRLHGALPAAFGRWWVDPGGADAGPGARFFRHDPKEARALLRAAGQEGIAFRFIYPHNAFGERWGRGAEATAKMLREAGFAPQPVPQDFAREFSDPRGTFFGGYEGVFYGLATPAVEPHDFLYGMLHSRSRRNHAGIADPRLDALIEEQARTLDAGARLERVRAIQRYLLERLYYVPLATGDGHVALQPWVRRYHYSPTYGAGTETFAGVWLERD
jgi:peptide/nickel transport system substrate-binding protein